MPPDAPPQIVEVVSAALAVARKRTSWAGLGEVIPVLFERVYAAKLGHTGHNVIVYRNVDEELDLECGVEFAGKVPAHPDVVASSTPAGRAATVTHVGPYALLSHSHTRVIRWLYEQSLGVAGVSWEIYGDWSDDPARLRTQIFHLLA